MPGYPMPATAIPVNPMLVDRHVAPLAALVRGDTVESVHAGHVAVVDAQGRVVFAAGNPAALVYTRSTLKPLQALPFVVGGGLARFGYTSAQTALLCASHSGEAHHVAAAASILAAAGCREDELLCGSHEPYFYDATKTYPPPPPYSSLAHNCSGKHAGMLACCALHGWTHAGYVETTHPLQQAIRAAVARTCSVAEATLVAGTDGCSAPNYAMPLAALAHAYARLATARPDDSDPECAALGTLAAAMRAHPQMVSGTARSDLALAQAGGGDWLPKAGAEGVQALGVTSKGLGIAIKVADGQARALPTITVAILQQLGLIDGAPAGTIARFTRPALRNLRGMVVGYMQSSVRLLPPAAMAPATTRNPVN